MKEIIVCILLLCCVGTAYSQAMFEPGNISNNEAFGPSFSPDGKEVYFTASFGGRDTLQIYYSRKQNGKWTKPVPAPFADKRYKQIDPFVSPDGKMLLFNTNPNGTADFDVYAVYRKKKGWTSPQPLGPEINSTYSDFYATSSRNGNIYFTRRVKSNDIYVSRLVNGKYQPAELLGPEINTDGNESNPYISPDEDYLIFFSDRPGGSGETDLYVSFAENGRWSYPINLGTSVNSEIGEFCPGADLKNDMFYFSRTQVINGRRKENMYFVPMKDLKLTELRKQARYK